MCPIFTGNMEEMKKLREKDPTFDIDCVDGVRNQKALISNSTNINFQELSVQPSNKYPLF